MTMYSIIEKLKHFIITYENTINVSSEQKLENLLAEIERIILKDL